VIGSKKLLVAGGAVALAAGLSAGLTGASVPQVHHDIDWGSTSVTFTIPFPGSWQFEVNEPDQHVLVEAVYGSTGTLTIDYPVGFCGLLQADASQSGVHNNGSRYTVTDCTVPTTTTTTTSPSTTTTTSPPSPPPPTTTVSPPTSPTTVVTTPSPQPAAAPQVVPSPTSTTVPGQLPNIQPAQNGVTTGNG
jgi:hypothetical protein